LEQREHIFDNSNKRKTQQIWNRRRSGGMPKTEVKIKIRSYHADNQNHVNSARYLEFFEEGSWDYLEKNPNVGGLMKSLAEKGIIHVVVNINCNYRNAAVAGDVLRIETELCRSTNRSFTFLKKVFNDKSAIIVVDAKITCVFIDSVSGEVVPINEEMKSRWPELADQI
jgi:thioesterase-3